MSNFSELMKQAQEMQKKMQWAQQKLADMEVTGEAGGGLVKIVLNCQYKMRRMQIDPSLLDEGPDIVAEVIMAAYKNAADEVEKLMKEEMMKLTQGLKLPQNIGNQNDDDE